MCTESKGRLTICHKQARVEIVCVHVYTFAWPHTRSKAFSSQWNLGIKVTVCPWLSRHCLLCSEHPPKDLDMHVLQDLWFVMVAAWWIFIVVFSVRKSSWFNRITLMSTAFILLVLIALSSNTIFMPLHWIVHTGLFTHPTLSYPILHLILQRMAEQGCGSYLSLPHPTTTFFVLHWSVQPSYLIVLYHTSYYVLHWIVQPTLSYHYLLHPTLRPTVLFMISMTLTFVIQWVWLFASNFVNGVQHIH